MNWYKISQTSNDPQLAKLVEQLKSTYPGLMLSVWNSNNGWIELNEIKVPKEMRNQGIGSLVIKKIQEYAKSVGKPIRLTPSPEPGKKGALQRFYRNVGFIPNKGRNIDYQLSSPLSPTWYWKPKK